MENTLNDTEAVVETSSAAETPSTACSRKEILPAFCITVVAAVALYVLMMYLQPMLMNNNFIYDFGTMMSGCVEGSIEYYVAWFFADLTEGSFIAALPASIGMIIMGFVAAALERKKSKHAGTGVAGNGHIFLAMFLTTCAALILGQVIYGSLFSSGWIPTFAVVLTVQVFVIFYGVNWKKILTSLIVGTIITFPVCYWLLYGIVSPLGLPLFIAVSVGVAIVVPLCSLIFRLMPWMDIPAPAPGSNPTDQNKSKFFVHQILGDIGQLTIWGSSWATVGMYIGGIIGWVMNPLHPAYGSGNFPLLIMVQVVTGALAILIWYPKWKKNGMAFTFAGIVFASAIVSTYPPSWAIVIPTIIIGAVVFAPLVDWVLKVFRFKGTYHPICLIQLSIFTVCAAWSFAVMYLIMPMLA
ncbi:hypothetical protein [Gordonibacter sp.]|uniref:hypothetical protein n=1 Tax=Gordonibacter sp. TaxID=1968902 RepID=UPI0025C50EDA|nr:hypothetical protein [Gordonibacter sp.]